MNEAYTKLMLQQSLSDEANAAFYAKLENAQSKKRMSPALRWAAIAACLCLLVPVTAWAVENIFGLATVHSIGQVTVEDQSGLGVNISFDDIKSYPVTAFSADLQTLDGWLTVYYDTWEEAEEHLGIDLLSNRICTDKDTVYYDYYIEDGSPLLEHCAGMYRGADNQLLCARIGAAYQRGRAKFMISATVTAEHPSMTEVQLQDYHSGSHLYFEQFVPHITTEQYTTKSGIPATICAVSLDGMTEYTAYFAVNDISYKVWMIGYEGFWDDAAVYTALCEVLEGFTLE